MEDFLEEQEIRDPVLCKAIESQEMFRGERVSQAGPDGMLLYL